MEPVIVSSGNVFEDLELPEPEERLAKAELARKIAEIIKKRHLSPDETAKILGVDQSKVSAIMHGRLAGFSFERLFQFLIALGRDIQITVKSKPRSRERGELQIQ